METDNEKRRLFDALAPVAVSSEEVRSLGHGEGFKDKVLRWHTDKGSVFGSHHNIDRGWNILFGRKNARNVLSHWAGDGKVALLEHVPELIERGIYLDTTEQNSQLDSYIFAAKAVIDDTPYVVGFVVRSDNNGMRYYDHVIIHEVGWTESRIRASETTARNLSKNPNSVYNILKKHLGVNSEAKKVSTACG